MWNQSYPNLVKNCVVSAATGATTFNITDTKLYVPVVTLSTPESVNLLKWLKLEFSRTTKWNKY